MAIDFSRAFGIHEQALRLRARRSEILAANLANADTPGYKARDIDFKSVLSQARDNQKLDVRMKVTHTGHIKTDAGAVSSSELLYRIPPQPSLDGNTTEPEVEQAEFATNALQYQASFRFLNGRIKGLLSAIKGE